MPRRTRVELYRWLLTADPPICVQGGNPVAVLNSCSRRRRGEECWCRFDVVEAADDLEGVGADDLIEWLNDDLEPEDVSDLAEKLEAHLRRADAEGPEADQAQRLRRRLKRVADRGSGLSGAYADDVDE
ncbi:MAG TPA: hypothetical protein VKR30_10435 [Candidatus Limnocylindrales bacterium]|nr:hypothetical protein [Candidatus Limnocylindrales bacterium]